MNLDNNILISPSRATRLIALFFSIGIPVATQATVTINQGISDDPKHSSISLLWDGTDGDMYTYKGYWDWTVKFSEDQGISQIDVSGSYGRDPEFHDHISWPTGTFSVGVDHQYSPMAPPQLGEVYYQFIWRSGYATPTIRSAYVWFDGILFPTPDASMSTAALLLMAITGLCGAARFMITPGAQIESPTYAVHSATGAHNR